MVKIFTTTTTTKLVAIVHEFNKIAIIENMNEILKV